MKKVNDHAARVLTTLTEGLEVGEARTIDSAPGIYMAVHVDRLSENRYAVAHYYDQNGDRVPDPDMEFYRGGDRGFYPLTIQHSTGHYTRAVDIAEDGEIRSYSWMAQKELATFANMWMKNVAEQQKLRLPPLDRDRDEKDKGGLAR